MIADFVHCLTHFPEFRNSKYNYVKSSFKKNLLQSHFSTDKKLCIRKYGLRKLCPKRWGFWIFNLKKGVTIKITLRVLENRDKKMRWGVLKILTHKWGFQYFPEKVAYQKF